jgi:cellulose synthase (UDP-forming)
VFLSWTPRLVYRYKLRVALQFLFSQTWYLLWSVSMLALWGAPLIALLSDRRIAATSLGDYFLYFAPVALAGWLLWCFARPWFKPQGLRISWRGAVLTVARWPVVLWALLSVVMRIKRPYMITPKGVSAAHQRRTIVAHAPLLGFATVALVGVWLSNALGDDGDGRAYVLLVLLNALITVVAAGTSLLLDTRSPPAQGESRSVPLPVPVVALAWLVALVGAFAATTAVFWDSVLAAVS